MAYDTDSLRRLVGSGARGSSGAVSPGNGRNATSVRREPPLLHPKPRLPLAKVTACFVCLVGVVASFEDGTASPAVPNLCNLAQEQPMYCRCSSEHFEADTTGVVCYVGKPLTGGHAVFQALRRQKALVSVTFTVYGEDYRLDFVPTDSLRQLGRLERLRFTDCNLGVLHTRAFYKLSTLTLLQLEGNDIIDLQPEAIAHLPRLEKLELGENKLRHVKAGWFSRLPSLIALFLGKNQIEYVEDLAFAELEALRELELGDNFIHEVTNRTFKGLAQLTRLDLYRNKLTRLDAGIFVSMPLLEELDLKLNQISVIDPLAFDGLARLRLIYLASNQLRILPADMFVGAPNLNLVDLEQNKLVTLTWRTIHNLKYLEDGEDFTMGLTGNQMACDCRLAWILRIENATQSEKFRRELRHVSCVFSDPARGKSKVTRLSMEDLGCPDKREPFPPTPPHTISPPEEESTSHAYEGKTKRPSVTEKKKDSSAKPKSTTTEDNPASSAPRLLSALFTLIISAVLCCGRTFSTRTL
ncbi:leucine-rich repeat-containing protein 15 [Rhipicephalus sanguineus]|uniref:leucine-rich repeat-containing protein 15 n=1 Tax=Rhipicephalus sanguineus TaxID=34632 RepID=UPI001896149C|nr:leucine-rich repeat-containing protein 15 [Rhipicephalus sanguineus]